MGERSAAREPVLRRCPCVPQQAHGQSEAAGPLSMPMPSIMAAPRSSRRSAPSRSITTISVAFSRPPRIGSTRCTDASPTAMSIRVPGAEDSTPPSGFRCWIGRRCLIPATSTTVCSCPSSCTVATITGVRCSDRQGGEARPGTFCATPTTISQRSSRPCVNTGCRSATLARADYGPRGTSYRLRLISKASAALILFAF
jgi:hypothetical protein